jgi:fimbrial chaperone protein
MELGKRILRQAVVAWFGMLLPATLWCGSFTFNPVRIQVSSSRPNAILQVTNHGDDPVTLQAHIVTWSLEGQNDVYADSDDVVLNPPIATVGPHQTQFLRLGLRRQVEGSAERTYRLIVEEVPPPPTPDFRGVHTLLKVSIPIFANPKTATAPRIEWKAVKTDDSRLRLIALNHGSAHVQIRSLQVTSADSPDDYLKAATATYLLPSQQREWLIDDKRALTNRQIKVFAVTDAGVLHEMVEVSP